MNIRKKIGEFFGVEKRTRTDAINFIGQDGPTGSPSKTDLATLMLTIESNPWVYAALYSISTAPLQVPFNLFKDFEGNDEIERPEVIAFLRQPSPTESYEDFVMQLMMALELSGNAFIEWVVDGALREAYVLPSGRVTIRPSARDRVDSYLYKTNGKTIRFERDDIVHVKWPNPNDALYGLAPIKAVQNDLICEYWAQTYNQSFFKNGATLDGVLETDGELDDVTFDRLQEQWRNRYTGANKAHKTAILESGLKFKPLSVTPKDMQFKDMRKWNRESVLAALGVPPVMVGVFEFANYANSDIQKRMFWEETMLPKLKKLEGALTKVIQKLFGEGIFFRFNVGEIRAMQENQNELASTVQGLTKDGLITPDEGREMLGKSEYPNKVGAKPLSSLSVDLLENVTSGVDGNAAQENSTA